MEDSDSELEYHNSNDSLDAMEPECTPDDVTSDDSVAQGRGHSKALVQKLLKEVMIRIINISLPTFNANLISVQLGPGSVHHRL